MGLELWLGAFWDLSPDRDQGFGLGAIPWRSIRLWAEAHQLDPEEEDDLFYFTRVLDEAFLKYHRPKK